VASRNPLVFGEPHAWAGARSRALRLTALLSHFAAAVSLYRLVAEFTELRTLIGEENKRWDAAAVMLPRERIAIGTMGSSRTSTPASAGTPRTSGVPAGSGF